LRRFSSVAARRTTQGRVASVPRAKAATPSSQTVPVEGFQIFEKPLSARYMAKTPAIRPIMTGTHRRAAATRSSRKSTCHLTKPSSAAAIRPPSTGEITQLAAIAPMVGQLTMPKPAAAMPAPSTPPTIECVVETGAFRKVAR
jgi:hypothetical protein